MLHAHRSRGPFRPRRHAYTLIEILIVVGILGLAGTLVMPRLIGREQLEVQAVVRLLVSDLSFAQSDALAHQEYRRVQFIPNDGSAWGNKYAIIRVDASTFNSAFEISTADYVSDPLSNGGDSGRYLIDFSADDRFQDVEILAGFDGTNQFVTYDALGGNVSDPVTPSAGGVIVVQNSDATIRYLIQVAPFTGKITVQRLI